MGAAEDEVALPTGNIIKIEAIRPPKTHQTSKVDTTTTIDLTGNSPDLEGEGVAADGTIKPKVTKIRRKQKDTNDLPRTLRSHKARPNYAE